MIIGFTFVPVLSMCFVDTEVVVCIQSGALVLAPPPGVKNPEER